MARIAGAGAGNGWRWRVLVALAVLAGCPRNVPLTEDSGAAADAPLSDGADGAGTTDARVSGSDAIGTDGVVLDGVPLDRSCAPSYALVGRVDPERLRRDLDALAGLGDRNSQAGQARAASYIRGELNKLGVPVREQSYSWSEKTYVNLEVTIAGSEDPNEMVMAGGHYDCAAGMPGADDNASGTAALLEAARVLAGCQPKRTIRLLFFSNEEAGDIGSTAYVKELKASVAPSQVIGFIALDMVAYSSSANGALTLATRPPYQALASAMQLATQQWTALPATLEISETCG